MLLRANKVTRDLERFGGLEARCCYGRDVALDAILDGRLSCYVFDTSKPNALDVAMGAMFLCGVKCVRGEAT
jgi:hypothetical protein